MECYNKIEDSIAFALNNIKSQVNMLAEVRGYESPLMMTLEQSTMKKETLDAMLSAMREYMPKFHEYLKAKAQMLGHKNGLPWYDLFAPIGSLDKKYSLEEARDYLVDSFRSFSADMAEMMETAFHESWIDFYPHAGKVGGAFCSNLSSIKQSRILSNYDGSFNAVDTLAHELGHAYHGMQIENNLPLNLDYSMPVAETASTFNETHITKKAIAEAVGDEKLALLENLLSNTTQTICDIYSRYLFESEVFEQCKDRFLMAEDLKEIMIQAQKEAYGDGLDHDVLHPYMWACKGHYYSESLSFYNFPYAFGALFSMGLYTMFEKEGEAFVPKYREMLKNTPMTSVEGAAKIVGVDLTKPDFWRASLEGFAQLIDEFISLSK
ncbi:MAG: M3 family oligoendopeptidase [Lachnospiraceae bacterium]